MNKCEVKETRDNFKEICDACSDSLKEISNIIDCLNFSYEDNGINSIAKVAALYSALRSVLALERKAEKTNITVWGLAKLHNVFYCNINIVTYASDENILVYSGDYSGMPEILRNLRVDCFSVDNEATLWISI